jgi:hypothetical protein
MSAEQAQLQSRRPCKAELTCGLETAHTTVLAIGSAWETIPGAVRSAPTFTLNTTPSSRSRARPTSRKTHSNRP